MVLPAAANKFYNEQQRKTAAVLQAAKTIWGTRPPKDFDAWFARNVDALVGIVVTGQQAVIGDVSDYVGDALGEVDFDPEILGDPDPRLLIGIASDGRPLDSLLYGSVITTKGTIAQANEVTQAVISQAWQSGLNSLMMRMQMQIADASRVATGLEIATRRSTGYVRMLNPPSCSRCIVLAGRWYRFSAGFLRHPGCNCRHIPAAEDMEDDLRTDPLYQFLSMPEAMQDKVFTKSGAEAIRQGADINQVVNARRGMSTTQQNVTGWIPKGRLARRNVFGEDVATTTEGTSRRGLAYKAMAAAGYAQRQTDVRVKGERYFRAKAPRLMPETIFEIATDRADALRLLRLNGYVFDRPATPQRGVSRPGGNRRAEGVDLDKAAADAAAKRLADAQLVAYLEAEKKYLRDVESYLAAEKKYLADVKKYLAAEKRFIAAERKRRAAAILSDETRELVTRARATFPKGVDGWRHTVAVYPEDKYGALVVPAELASHLDSTLEVGAAIRRDAQKSFAKDARIKELIAEDKNLLRVGDPFSPRRSEIVRDRAKRERELIEKALAEVRDFGGVQQDIVVIKDQAQSPTSDVTPATTSTVTALRRAETVFPADWLRAASARGKIVLGITERPFFSTSGGGGNDLIAGYGDDPIPWYQGSFTDYPEEVMAHELGHRMEQTIPGLTHLEFALVRKRSTVNGVLESLTPIWPGQPEMASEVGYADKWTNKYAGKSYEYRNPGNPATASAEAFQVGLQDTFGRSNRNGEYDDTGELQEFVMGVLALL